MDIRNSNKIAAVRLTYSIFEVTQLLGISRASLYRVIARGELKTVKIGHRTLVLGTALTRSLMPYRRGACIRERRDHQPFVSWCGKSFRPHCGGKKQLYCSAECKHEHEAALRAWAQAQERLGKVTADELRAALRAKLNAPEMPDPGKDKSVVVSLHPSESKLAIVLGAKANTA